MGVARSQDRDGSVDGGTAEAVGSAPAWLWAWGLGVTGLAALLRWRALTLGFSPDEFANVHPGGAWAILTDPETAVNPPVVRWLANLPADGLQALWTGRAVSWASSVATVPLLGWLAWRASRSPLATAWAAGTLAVAPAAVVMAARARAYGLFGLELTVHLLALSVLAAGATGARARRARAVAVGSAVALAWTHYLSVPLALLAMPWLQARGVVRRAVWLWGPAAVSVVPLAPIVLGVSETRVAMPGTLADSLRPILGAGFAGWLTAFPTWRPVLESTGLGLVVGAWLPGAALGLAVLAALVWPRVRTGSRTGTVVATAAAAVLGSVLLLSTVQFVRSPVGTMWLVAALPAAAAAVGALRTTWARAVAVAVLSAALLPGVSGVLSRQLTEAPEAALRTVAEDWDAVAAGTERVWVHPGWAYTGLHLYLTDRHIREAVVPPDGDCPNATCFQHEGVVVARSDQREPGDAGRLVVLEDRPPDDLAEGCTAWRTGWRLWIGDCGGAAGSPTWPDGGDP